MISQTLEYALRAIVAIAQHDGEPCTARKISAITKAPAAYVSKMLQSLVRGRLVSSKRGLRGGFLLAKPPSDLTVWEVVQVVEPWKRIHECPLGIGAHGDQLCPLHRRLDDAMALVESSFRDTTIAQLLAQPGRTPLCDDRPC